MDPAGHRHVIVGGGRTLPLVVRRNPRARRLTLRLAATGDRVTVSIPPSAAIVDGIALARDNAAWIAARLAALPARVPFAAGQTIPLRGIDHRIGHCPRATVGIDADNGLISVGGSAVGLSARLERWLRDQARADLTAEVALHAARRGRTPGRISVRDPRSRWGSCAVNGNLSFSWRLILAPPSVLAYVVVHELAHLTERNHGPRFWAQVDAMGGDVSAARAWLRRHGPDLHRYG